MRLHRGHHEDDGEACRSLRPVRSGRSGRVPYADGARAFFDYANSQLNELGGRKVELVVKDTQYNPQLAIQAYRDVQNEVAGIPLSFGSAATSAIGPELAASCMPLMANAGSASDQAAGVYFDGPTYEDNTLAAMQYYIIGQHHSHPRVAIFYQGDSYGQGALKALEFGAAKLGYTIVAREPYAPADSSFSGQLAAIKAAKPGVVLMASTVQATFGFFGAAQAAGSAGTGWASSRCSRRPSSSCQS